MSEQILLEDPRCTVNIMDSKAIERVDIAFHIGTMLWALLKSSEDLRCVGSLSLSISFSLPSCLDVHTLCIHAFIVYVCVCIYICTVVGMYIYMYYVYVCIHGLCRMLCI